MDGSINFDPRTDDPAPGEGDASEQEEPEDEETLFASLMSSINKLRTLPSVTEQTKLALEKAATLVQQIKAAEEKEMEGAMKGAMTPGLLRKANGGGGAPMGGGPGY